MSTDYLKQIHCQLYTQKKICLTCYTEDNYSVQDTPTRSLMHIVDPREVHQQNEALRKRQYSIQEIIDTEETFNASLLNAERVCCALYSLVRVLLCASACVSVRHSARRCSSSRCARAAS